MIRAPMPSRDPFRNALRLIVMINLPCLLLVAGMMWVSYRKAAETAASRAAYAPMDEKVRDIIETERDIDKLRSIARIQNLGASGSMEALLHMSKKATFTLLPCMIISALSLLVAGVTLRRNKKPADATPV